MTKLLPATLLALTLAACDGPKPAAKTEAAPAPVRNDTLLLPSTGQTAVRLVPNHMLDEPKLPGGTIADYNVNGSKYQMFVVRAESNQDAALMLLQLKAAMPNAEYLAHMGGYAGTHAGKPLYVFAKLQFLAGVVGLDKNSADNVARQLAAKLH